MDRSELFNMGLKVRHLAQQLNLPINQLVSELNKLGINKKIDAETVLTEEELISLRNFMKTASQNKNNDTDKHKQNNVDESDKRASYMDFIIKQSDLIFIDTSSLLQRSNEQFLDHLFFYLKKYNKKLILPYKVNEEIVKHQKNTKDKNLAKLANQALKKLVVIQNSGYLDIYGDKSLDNFADNVFNTQITRLRIKHSILLITNDIKLGKDVLLLNLSQSVKGKTIHVQKVDRFGYFQRIKLENNNQNHAGSNKYQHKTFKIPEHEKFALAISLTKVSESQIHLTKEVKEGEYVFTDKKTSIHLKKQIGSGGEGHVYLTDDEKVVAKIYKKEKLTVEKYEKLKLMVSKKISYDGICYPIDLLYNEYQEFIGFTMPKAAGKELRHFLFLPKKVFENRNSNWTRKDLVQLSITILEKIDYLHKRNIILGDINPFNILVVSATEVYFVDVDSYQVEGFPCPVGTDNYTAPEIQGKNYKEFLRTFGHEYFAVATLLFSILFLGKTPYSQTGGDTNSENIKNMDFPYTYGKEERAENTPKGQWRYIWSNLPYRVKKAFYQTFQKGQPHSFENNRLKTADWLSIMEKYYADLDSGRLIEQDEIANDIFPNRFKMIGDTRKTLETCTICHESYPKWQLTKNICRSCLYKGEDYECGRCSKELIFTNFEKYVRKMDKPYEYCKDCTAHYNSVYKTIICSDCKTSFDFKYWDKEFYDSRNYHYPKRCPDCRRKKRAGTTNGTYKQTVHTSRTNEAPERKKRKSGWCFLTTVACEYYELLDDCYELEVLRSFRDNWLSKQTDGPMLIQQYYEEAPLIVEKIKNDSNYSRICESIMHDYILPCVRLIEQKQWEECKSLYKKLFHKASLLTN